MSPRLARRGELKLRYMGQPADRQRAIVPVAWVESHGCVVGTRRQIRLVEPRGHLTGRNPIRIRSSTCAAVDSCWALDRSNVPTARPSGGSETPIHRAAGGPPVSDTCRGLTGVTWLRHWDKETDSTGRAAGTHDRSKPIRIPDELLCFSLCSLASEAKANWHYALATWPARWPPAGRHGRQQVAMAAGSCRGR